MSVLAERQMSKEYPPGYTVRVPMSREDFLAMDPYQRWMEWVDGEALIMMAPPVMRHDVIAGYLTYLFYRDLNGVRAAPSGPVETPTSYRRPDVLLISDASFNDDTDDSRPLVLVEVLSPSTRNEDLLFKSVEYANAGALQYWIVDLEDDTIEIYFNVDGQWDRASRIVIDEAHPVADVPVGDYGTVHVDHTEVFD